MSKLPRVPTEEEKAAGGMMDSENDHSIVEEAGVAFDPTTQHLDLSNEEKRRTTALMMAISAYKELIIKDAEYLRVAYDHAQRGDGPKIQPATMNAMVEAAIQFDNFIAGKLAKAQDELIRGGSQTEDA